MTEEELRTILDDLTALPQETEWVEFKVNKAKKYAKYIPFWA